MRKHRIDITPSSEAVTTAITSVGTIATNLSFLIALEEGERKSLPRLGLRNETFAMGVIELARRNPQVVPAGIDMAAIERDVAAREMLLPLYRDLQRTTKLLEDTLTLLGFDIYEGSRALYKTMKVIGALYGLGEAIAELGRRFAKQSVTKTGPGAGAASTTES